jgi:ABC-type dipeptide/oligopeptide/nickel transport system permease component
MVVYLIGRIRASSSSSSRLDHRVRAHALDPRRAFRRGEGAAATAARNMLRKYGLDKPLPEQYLRYMGSACAATSGPRSRARPSP